MRVSAWFSQLRARAAFTRRRPRRAPDAWLTTLPLEERRVLSLTSVNAGADQTGVSEGDSASLSGATFEDTDLANNDPYAATIDWGDGTDPTPGEATVDGGVGNVTGSHTYADNGTYTVTVTVTGDDNTSASDQLSITVENEPPSLETADDQSVDEGELLALADIGTFTDPGTGDTHTATIDWGDGTDPEPGLVTELNGSGKVAGSHTYADNGVYTVTVTVMDDDGGSASETLEVTVGNVAPSLETADDQSVDEGELLALADIGTFTDPGTGDTHTATIDWGDGTDPEPGLVTELNGSGKVAGSHTYADDGVYTVTVTVMDDDGGSASETLEVTVGNVAPSLETADDQSVDEGELLALADIGTFTDPGTGDTHTATIDWGDGTDPEPGLVTELNGSGKVAGSHTYADNGVYTVTVTVMDDDGGSASETLEVTVGNVAPSLETADDQSVDEGELLALADIGTFTDPGTADTHTATIDWGDGTDPEPGLVTELNGSGKVAGSHTYADDGVYTVTVTVMDDDGASTSETLEVTVGNVDPTLEVVEDQEVDEGELLALADLGTFTDPGTADTHTATIDWGDGTDPEPGLVTEANGSGKIAGSHTYADDGVYTVTVTVTDDDGGSDTETFLVTVGNVAPALTLGDDQVTDEGSPLPTTLLGSFTDPGTGDTHTAAIDWGDGSPSEAATIVETGGSGTLDADHVYADDGVYTVTVTLTDDDGGTDEATFEVTVNNVAPDVTPVGTIEIDEDVEITPQLLAEFTDPGVLDTHTATIDWGDGSPVEAAALTEPTNPPGTVSGGHTYAEPGVYTVTITVIDDDGGIGTATLTVVVGDVIEFLPPVTPPPPEAGPVAATSTFFASTNVRRDALLELSLELETTDARGNLTDGGAINDPPAASDSVAAIEKRFVLRVVFANGLEGESIPLHDDALGNLAALWLRLPDNHYRIYQVQEDGTERLVIDVTVQKGRVIDPNDRNETQDQPPTTQWKPQDGPLLVAIHEDPAERSFDYETWRQYAHRRDGALQTPLAARPSRGEVEPLSEPDADRLSERELENHGPLLVGAFMTAGASNLVALGGGREQDVDRALAQFGNRALQKGGRRSRRRRPK